jgi:cytochrome P450
MEAELDRVLGDRDPEMQDIGALPYTKAVFLESMRLYPPAWLLARAPVEDETIDGYFIPAGSRIFLCPWVIHRHPEFWPDPEGFDPERFLDESAIDKFAYLPFGGGPRLCIGHAFAKMEGVLVLATLSPLARVRPRRCAGGDHHPAPAEWGDGHSALPRRLVPRVRCDGRPRCTTIGPCVSLRRASCSS